MGERERFYAVVLGIQSPWQVSCVELVEETEEVRVLLKISTTTRRLPCPDCDAQCPGYDTRSRSWRHLDTCQFKTILQAEIPRVKCPTHGVRQIAVPWAEPGSGFTALMESLVIDWLKEASIKAVSRLMGLTWDQIDGVMQRAVRRGMARRKEITPTRIGIDETSFKKRHEYVTVVSDHETSDVLYVADNRKQDSLDGFFDQLEPADILRIEAVSMDMWEPYISAIKFYLHDAEKKICFDKFHVAQHLGNAVDKVRRLEHRKLMAEDDRTLVKSKYVWLKNPDNMGNKLATSLARLKTLALQTARAWAIKEHAMCLWHYISRTWARKAWEGWISWAMRSRLEPIKKVARMVRAHLDGIINAIVLRATNAGAESVNSKIQKVKRMACGFRNRDRFRTAIYFHLGGLDLRPATHTRS